VLWVGVGVPLLAGLWNLGATPAQPSLSLPTIAQLGTELWHPGLQTPPRPREEAVLWLGRHLSYMQTRLPRALPRLCPPRPRLCPQHVHTTRGPGRAGAVAGGLAGGRWLGAHTGRPSCPLERTLVFVPLVLCNEM
jgi:hypothetical protein